MHSPAPLPHEAPAASTAVPRDPWRDNARFLLIVLVVLGHCLEPLGDEVPAYGAIYRFIYLFHIPAFAFLSGSVARPEADLRLLRTIAFRLLLPYLLFQGAYALAAQAPGWPDEGPDGPATPYWLLWYLVSLAGWRLLLPVFTQLRRPLLIAVVLAVAAGWADDVGYYLSVSRTLVFFPLFLLGWRYAGSWQVRLSGPRWRAGAIGVLLLLGVMATTVATDPRWLYGSQGYAALDADEFHGAVWRLLQIAANALGAAAFLALVPRRRLAFTRLGPGSLQAFLTHGFLVKWAVAAGAFAWLQASLPPWAVGALLLGLALVVVVALSGEHSRRWLSPLTTPRWLEQWLWRDPAPPVSERPELRP